MDDRSSGMTHPFRACGDTIMSDIEMDRQATSVRDGEGNSPSLWVPEDVKQAEFEEVRNRRKNAKLTLDNSESPPKDLKCVGLALSGGGLRSAAFNLGLLQALDEEGVLRQIDYVSTVSGGGYVGALMSVIAATRKTSSEDTGAEETGDAETPSSPETPAAQSRPATGSHTSAGNSPRGQSGTTRLLPELGTENEGRRPGLVQRLIRGGMYLVSLPQLLHSYLAGLVCVVMFAVSGTLALTCGLTLLFRVLDQRPVLRWLYALGFQSDVERVLIPAGLGIVVWIGLTLIAYGREYACGLLLRLEASNVSGRLARVLKALLRRPRFRGIVEAGARRRPRIWQIRALIFTAVTLLIALALLLGTGDIDLPSLGWGQKVELGQIQGFLVALLPLLLILGLLPYLRPQGVDPQRHATPPPL